MKTNSEMSADALSKSRRTLVMKFGGTSVGSSEAVQQVVEIVRSAKLDWPRLVIVASALSGVTNLLLDCAAQAEKGDASPAELALVRMRKQHSAILENLVRDPALKKQIMNEVDKLLNEFTNLCRAIAVLGEATPRCPRCSSVAW